METYTQTKGSADSPRVRADWPVASISPGSELRESTTPATGAVRMRSCATASVAARAALALASSARAAWMRSGRVPSRSSCNASRAASRRAAAVSGRRLRFVHGLAAHRAARAQRTDALNVPLGATGLRLRLAEIGLGTLDLAAARAGQRLLERGLRRADPRLVSGNVRACRRLPEDDQRVAGGEGFSFVRHDAHDPGGKLRGEIDLANLDGAVAHDFGRGAAVAAGTRPPPPARQSGLM